MAAAHTDHDIDATAAAMERALTRPRREGPDMTGGRIEVALLGLGPMGVIIARGLLERTDLDFACAADIDPAKVGRDLAELTGRQARSLTIADRIGSPRSPRAGVCIVCTFSSLEQIAPQILDLVARGWHVVSTCEELSEPWSRPEIARQLDEAARAAGVAILGSGINPGYLLDTLPLLLTAACLRVDAVHVRRVVDTNKRRVPLQRKAGVGLDREVFEGRVRDGQIRHVGLAQSARLLASGLGWEVETWSEAVEPVMAQHPVQTGVGDVRPGQTIGLNQSGTATAFGRPVITYQLQMFAGAPETDEITIEGEPEIHALIAGGLNGDVGTAAVIGNLASLLPRTRPGLLTMRDAMPLAGFGNRFAGQSGRATVSSD